MLEYICPDLTSNQISACISPHNNTKGEGEEFLSEHAPEILYLLATVTRNSLYLYDDPTKGYFLAPITVEGCRLWIDFSDIDYFFKDLTLNRRRFRETCESDIQLFIRLTILTEKPLPNDYSRELPCWRAETLERTLKFFEVLRKVSIYLRDPQDHLKRSRTPHLDKIFYSAEELERFRATEAYFHDTLGEYIWKTRPWAANLKLFMDGLIGPSELMELFDTLSKSKAHSEELSELLKEEAILNSILRDKDLSSIGFLISYLLFAHGIHRIKRTFSRNEPAFELGIRILNSEHFLQLLPDNLGDLSQTLWKVLFNPASRLPEQNILHSLLNSKKFIRRVRSILDSTEKLEEYHNFFKILSPIKWDYPEFIQVVLDYNKIFFLVTNADTSHILQFLSLVKDLYPMMHKRLVSNLNKMDGGE